MFKIVLNWILANGWNVLLHLIVKRGCCLINNEHLLWENVWYPDCLLMFSVQVAACCHLNDSYIYAVCDGLVSSTRAIFLFAYNVFFKRRTERMNPVSIEFPSQYNSSGASAQPPIARIHIHTQHTHTLVMFLYTIHLVRTFVRCFALRSARQCISNIFSTKQFPIETLSQSVFSSLEAP